MHITKLIQNVLKNTVILPFFTTQLRTSFFLSALFNFAMESSKVGYIDNLLSTRLFYFFFLKHGSFAEFWIIPH